MITTRYAPQGPRTSSPPPARPTATAHVHAAQCAPTLLGRFARALDTGTLQGKPRRAARSSTAPLHDRAHGQRGGNGRLGAAPAPYFTSHRRVPDRLGEGGQPKIAVQVVRAGTSGNRPARRRNPRPRAPGRPRDRQSLGTLTAMTGQFERRHGFPLAPTSSGRPTSTIKPRLARLPKRATSRPTRSPSTTASATSPGRNSTTATCAIRR